MSALSCAYCAHRFTVTFTGSDGIARGRCPNCMDDTLAIKIDDHSANTSAVQDARDQQDAETLLLLLDEDDD